MLPSQARRLQREQEIKHEPAYFAYLDALYARHHLTTQRMAVLAELVPLLGLSERAKLSKLMRAAGYDWEGLTDKY